MTIENIIRMAKEAGFADEEIDICQQILIHFAKLVAEDEREACVKIVDENIGFENYLSEIIRARVQA